MRADLRRWLRPLESQVNGRPIVVVRVNQADSASLRDSRHGLNEFTIARPHRLFSQVRTPNVCLIYETDGGWGRERDQIRAYVGIVTSLQKVTTLETRIKIRRGMEVLPNTEGGLISLLKDSASIAKLKEKLADKDEVVMLSPRLSEEIIRHLAKDKKNYRPLSVVSDSVCSPQKYSSAYAQQEDAVQTALRSFGLGASDRADELQLVDGRASALARVQLLEDSPVERAESDEHRKLLYAAMPRRITLHSPLIEDSVIEHDARTVRGFKLKSSDLTGRAVFHKGTEQLEIYTANRRVLERVFGVDLIYLNITRGNMVMVQYKMLEPFHKSEELADWIYRPDMKLAEEVRRMDAFCEPPSELDGDYRLNSDLFYLKFVKRDSAIRNGGIIMPLSHYKLVVADDASIGPRGGVNISYRSLNGRYLRQSAFIDLIHSGYIGSRTSTTERLQVLVDATLAGNRAVIVAIQRERSL